MNRERPESVNGTGGREVAMLNQIWKFAPGLRLLSHYDKSWLANDMAAGLSVAAVALPVGIAYSALVGVPAVYGIYAAIFPLFAYALFGSSKQLMTGPDAATCIIVASSLGPLAGGDVARYQALMVMLTLCTGVVYIIAGVARLGFIANFLSLPILTGFLNGISLLIIVGQVQKLLGFSVEAEHFFPALVGVVEHIDQTHIPTFYLGCGLLIGLFGLKKLFPRLPSALVIVVIGIGLVDWLSLKDHGIALLGAVPAGLPTGFSLPEMSFGEYKLLFRDAAALTLVSFTSGILTAKSFAQKNKYEIDTNQELIAFGACNIASGLAQGFPVTGADSRTAVCSAMGGKSQMVGVFAGLAMLLVLFFLTEPLQSLPIAALAAVIIVAAIGLFDVSTLKRLLEVNRIEFALSVGTTIGVLILGALPGVMLAVALSLIMLLAVNSKPPHAVLGWVPDLESFHNIKDHPSAQVIGGLLIFRFEANVVFFNIDYFLQCIRAEIVRSASPVKWVVVDCSPINMIDVTAGLKFQELRSELEKKGILLKTAKIKQSVRRYFSANWRDDAITLDQQHSFSSLKAARKAFEKEMDAGPRNEA